MSLHAELNEMRASNEELRRELRASNVQLQELKDAQQGFSSRQSAVSRHLASDAVVIMARVAKVVIYSLAPHKH